MRAAPRRCGRNILINASRAFHEKQTPLHERRHTALRVLRISPLSRLMDAFDNAAQISTNEA
jgi:hypothetical protein